MFPAIKETSTDGNCELSYRSARCVFGLVYGDVAVAVRVPHDAPTLSEHADEGSEDR
jgi:hypothetical protein